MKKKHIDAIKAAIKAFDPKDTRGEFVEYSTEINLYDVLIVVSFEYCVRMKQIFSGDNLCPPEFDIDCMAAQNDFVGVYTHGGDIIYEGRLPLRCLGVLGKKFSLF
jgi:hypothetical protein